MTTSNRNRNTVYTTLGDNDVNVTFINLDLYKRTILPSPEAQRILNECILKSFTLSYESWTTDRKPVDTAQAFQLDIGSESKINAPLYLIEAHQKTQRTDHANTLSNKRFKKRFLIMFMLKNTK